MPVRTYLDGHSVFEPEAIEAMSKALEETCKALHINGQAQDRETIAARIIDLARNGVVDAKALSNRVVARQKLCVRCERTWAPPGGGAAN